MNVVRSLWASVQSDPVFMRRANGYATIAWLVIGVIGVSTNGIRSSIPVLFFISVYANVAGHLSSWQAARVEVTQAEEAEERERAPVEEKVVEAIVERTDVQPDPHRPMRDPSEGTKPKKGKRKKP